MQSTHKFLQTSFSISLQTHTQVQVNMHTHTHLYMSILFNETDNRYKQRIIVYFALCWQPCVVKCMRNNCKHISL